MGNNIHPTFWYFYKVFRLQRGILMNKIYGLVFVLFSSFSFGQEVIYGPRSGDVSGNVTSNMVFSSFRTGPTVYQLTSVELSNFVEGNYDQAFLYELNGSMMIVRVEPLQYQSSRFVENLGTLNQFKPFAPLILKARTRYGIFWISGQNIQSLNSFSERMLGSKNTGLKQVANYYFDGTLSQMSENLILIINGDEL